MYPLFIVEGRKEPESIPPSRYTIITQNKADATRNLVLVPYHNGSNWCGDMVILKNDEVHRRCISHSQLWSPEEVDIVLRYVAEL